MKKTQSEIKDFGVPVYVLTLITLIRTCELEFLRTPLSAQLKMLPVLIKTGLPKRT